MENYTILSKAGQGAQGVVVKARCKKTSDIVAIKTIDVSTLAPAQREAALAEVSVLEALRDEPHPCIMGYRTSFVEDAMLCLVLDWCKGGTLQELVEAKQFAVPSSALENDIWAVAICVFGALQHCHSRGILHRDVKLANVFVDSEPGQPLRIKLGDFGVSCILGDRSRARTMVGTPYYLSPELCCGEPYDAKSDIWAAGVMLFQLCNDKMPYEASNYAALILRIVQANAAKQTARYDQALHALVSKCMAKNPRDRPTAVAVLRSPLIRSVATRLALPLFVSPQPQDPLPSPEFVGVAAGLPLRNQTLSKGSLPSRRVRNKHQQSKLSSIPQPPKPVAPRLVTAARTTRPPSATAAALESVVVKSEGRPQRPLSQAARQRAARSVAELPEFGSSDSDPDGLQLNGEEDVIPTANETPGYGVAVGWCVDGDSGVAAHTMDTEVLVPASTRCDNSGDTGGGTYGHSAVAPRDIDVDEDDDTVLNLDASEASLSTTTAPTQQEILGHIDEIHDDAERMIEPSKFLLLVDTLKTDPVAFEALLGTEPYALHADELTYLCFRYVMLEGELRRSV